MTYRAKPADGVAWVTGASAGIGRGVALELARRGWRVYATARRAHELEALAREAQALAGAIVAAPGDVTNRADVANLVAGIEAQAPIALAFLNAGGGFHDAPDDFGGDGFARTFALNVQGVANALNPAFNTMRARGCGQIAVTGSLAGYGGLPNADAYAPTKAAVIALTTSLRFRAARRGVTVQIVNPGFVKTPLTEGANFPMPFLMECDEASRRICNGFERGGFEIRFPRRLAWPMRALNLLPWSVYFWLMARGAPRRERAGG
jgi:NAD(P)-dependent dehydrogenase (short-subunit alcohol dehydrogenase family)